MATPQGSIHPFGSQSQSLRDALAQLRLRLLDLTGRNRLLNYKHPIGKSLQFVQAPPSAVYERLLDGKSSLAVKGLPEPTRSDLILKTGRFFRPEPRDWAIQNGIATSYDLADPKQGEAAELRTHMYLDDLAKHCRKIEREAHLAIEETGANMLYLVLGFLEYPDQKDSERIFSAPLIGIPVSVMKKDHGGNQHFFLQYTGDDIEENLSLREKLRKDHSLVMPPMDEEEIDVEGYFREIRKVINSRPGFALKRRVSLCLLSFTNMLLVRDLDPENWPTVQGQNGLLDHTIVKQIFGEVTAATESVSIDAEEHKVEEQPGDSIPLVFDADSSQHSALVDVICNSRNVVIEGPPGTGKSQTITNLIAASLSSGKKVLFVSEKLAALEVVRNRLGVAGLTPLLLELHSTKTSKKQVLESLQERLNLQASIPRDFHDKIEELQSHRRELKSYADQINAVFGNRLGLTVHEVMWRAHRFRRLLSCGEAPLRGVLLSDTEESSTADLARRSECLGYLASQFEQIGNFGDEHPLWGFFPHPLVPGEDLKIGDILESLSANADSAVLAVSALCSYLGGDFSLPRSNQAGVLKALGGFASAHGSELPFSLIQGFLREDASLQTTRREIDHVAELTSKFCSLSLDVELGIKEESCATEVALQALVELQQLSLSVGTVWETLVQAEQTLASINAEISNLKDSYSKIAEYCRVHEINSPDSETGLRQLEKLSSLVIDAPDEIFGYQSEALMQAGSVAALGEVRSIQQKWVDLEEKLAGSLYLDILPDPESLKAAILTLRQGSTWYRFLQPTWRSAVRLHRSLQRVKNRISSENRLTDLHKIADLQLLKGRWQRHTAWSDVLKRTPKTEPFDFEPFIKVATWNRDVSAGMMEIRGKGLAPMELTAERIRGWQRDLGGIPSQVQNSISALHGLSALMPKVALGSEDVEAALTRSREISHRLESLLSVVLQTTPRSVSVNAAIKAHQAALERRRLLTLLDGNELAKKLFRQEYHGAETDTKRLSATLEAVEDVLRMEIPVELRDKMLTGNCVLIARDLIDQLNRVISFFNQIETDAERLGNFGEFALEQWMRSESNGGLQKGIEQLQSRAKRAAQAKDCVNLWSVYVSRRQEAKELGLMQFIELLETRAVPANELANAYQHCFFSEIAKGVFRQRPQLRKFSGLKHDRIRQEFQRLDREIIRMRGREVAVNCLKGARPPQGHNGARVDEKTEMALVNHLLPQQRPRIALRKMLRAAGRAIQELKPCFMMGPQAVAQYLSSGLVKFDLVIMDEASQLKPEEAIGAVARGAQLVVVGDPKQLPPTSFFTRMTQTGEEEEQFSTTDAESILDVCLAHFRPPRPLRWHYRSQHQSLIAFSNHYFYRNLIIFPSPYGHSSRLGVRATYLPDAIYEDQTNLREAQRVVDAVVEHILNRPTESLGVVTLNLKQRDLIAELLEERLQSVKEAEHFKQRWASEAQTLFIKNLENVQGDERDAIVISTTFGKPRGADAVRQNFGPISRQGGWRRLNVLFTRAKKSIALFTSLRPEDIVVDNSTPEGTKALRNYLDYARSGCLTTEEETGHEPESDFELATIDFLKQHGYDVTPQLGVAGYRIDIAVKHPDFPGAYLAAIECDGAAYHSALTVRDRDRIRQEILEAMGWRGRVWRIWSTDWFRTPQIEAEKLTVFLADLRATWRPDYATGDCWVEEFAGRKAQESAKSDREKIEAALFADEDVRTVRVGDVVRYVDILKPEDVLTVQITESVTDLEAGLVHRGKPLAQTLLGAAVADEVSMHLPGARSRTFRVLEIKETSVQ
jgi:hypothetical protein